MVADRAVAGVEAGLAAVTANRLEPGGEPVYEKVPLSCVPPSSCPVGFAGLNDSDWNWIVFSPSFSGVIAVGIPSGPLAVGQVGRRERHGAVAVVVAERRSCTPRRRRGCSHVDADDAAVGADEGDRRLAGSNATACSSG